jgi:hypothetical protein
MNFNKEWGVKLMEHLNEESVWKEICGLSGFEPMPIPWYKELWSRCTRYQIKLIDTWSDYGDYD